MKQAGGKTAELVFQSNGEVLNSDYDIKNGNNPYYQWGRKDPMLPSNGLGDVDKTCYTTDTQYSFQHTGLNTNEIKEYIKNPHKFNIKDEMDGQYYNLWSTDNNRNDENDDKVIKSVYDPSPVGYSLPASNAFTGFSITGGYTENHAEFNIKNNFNKGYYFYRQQNKKGDTLFFYASGYRYFGSGALDYIYSAGCYWVAGPYYTDTGRYMGFDSNRLAPVDYARRSSGFAVRSAEEK